ncbi:MAG: hypothetical protein JWQ07_2833 [Ramlibacter sp.]|nr:hypothetical protein [Ramlibacter sp.]
MALKGQAFLALWNDIAPAREAEYDRWHTEEHVPERVAAAGIHEGRRYVNRTRASHCYFTFYDVEQPGVFESPEYVELLQKPTPWSEAMRPDFSNFVRSPCRLERSSGIGVGAAMACLCLAETAVADIAKAIDAAREMPRITGCHWGSRLGGLPAQNFKKTPGTTVETRAFNTVLLIEALDGAAAGAALMETKSALGMAGLPADFGADVYDLAFVFPGADRAARGRHRRLSWGKEQNPQ